MTKPDQLSNQHLESKLDEDGSKMHHHKNSTSSSSSSGYASNANGGRSASLTDSLEDGRDPSPVPPAPVWPKGRVAAQVERLQNLHKVPSSTETTVTSFPKSSPRVVVKHDPTYVQQVKIKQEPSGANLDFIQEVDEDSVSSCCTTSIKRDGRYVQSIQISANNNSKPVKPDQIFGRRYKDASGPQKQAEDDSIVTEALLQLTSLTSSSSGRKESGIY